MIAVAAVVGAALVFASSLVGGSCVFGFAMEWYNASDEGASSVRCAKLAWIADQLMDSAYPWSLPTLELTETPLIAITNLKRG